MQVEQLQWTAAKGWDRPATLSAASLVIYFGERAALQTSGCYEALRRSYPSAHIVGCSTGGEIFSRDVFDQSISVAAIHFRHTKISCASGVITSAADSAAVGAQLATTLNKPDLRYVLVLSDGTNVNGSDLVRGIYSVLPENIIVTGGLAGDGADFVTTVVGFNHEPEPKRIIAVGFYGEALKVGYGSVGGWRTFGPSWKITRSDGNILYELNGRPALDLYSIYLGDDAKNLPKDALLHPINIRSDQISDHDIVRTIVGIDREKKSLIFAGDVPEGYIARLMRAEFSQLVDGAASAATLGMKLMPGAPSLAILVSCIGRKLVLGPSIHHETEAIGEILGHVPTIGFYSYGEICHQEFSGKCGLHNQTMTITLLSEQTS